MHKSVGSIACRYPLLGPLAQWRRLMDNAMNETLAALRVSTFEGKLQCSQQQCDMSTFSTLWYEDILI
jgi:hypothetical protein